MSRPLLFGTAVHKIIEYRILGKTTEEALQELYKGRAQVFASEIDLWNEIVTDATVIMKSYDEHYRDEKIKYLEIGGRRAEHQFEVDLERGITFAGKIDTFASTPDHRVWLCEHKTRRGRIENDSVRARDMQTMLYIDFAAPSFHIKKVAGVMWDYVRSKSPSRPEPLKNGGLSKSRIDTLPAVYLEAIHKFRLNPKGYEDVLAVLKENEKSWFRRVFVPTNRHAISDLRDETRVTAREIRRKAGVDRTRNLTKDCSWCSYEKLCHAELFGMDSTFTREREYRVDEKVNPELEDDDAASD